MKIWILFLVYFFCFIGAKAQYDYTRDMMLIKTFDRSSEEIEGSPYFTENFEPGTIKIKGKDPLKVFLRYNVSKEEIEIKTELGSEKVYVLSKAKNSEYKINGVCYVLDKIHFDGSNIYGYFIEYFNGGKVRLLLKPIAEFFPAMKAKTGYEKDQPARFEIEKEYFLIFKNGNVENIRLKNRDLRKIFDTKFHKDYLSEHDIETVNDLVSFLEFHENTQK